jgi:MarR family 2-MHQ and catechol resistance regulon transcriptional repressor
MNSSYLDILESDTSQLEDRLAAETDILVVYNILRTHNALSPFVDRHLRDLNLTGAQLNALIVLHHAGPKGLPLSELGRHLVVTRSNVTGLMDRLERDGLAQRDTHPDRRITLAKLTEKGAALLEVAIPQHRQQLTLLLECLTTEEKEQLISLLTRLRRGLRDRRAKESS